MSTRSSQPDLTDPPMLSASDVKIQKETIAYDGFFQLKTYELSHKLMAGGWSETVKRECFMRPQAASLLPYDPRADTVVLVEQFRVGCLDALEGPFPMELVAGIIEEGETPEQVAVRECREESGAEVLDVEFICDYRVSPGGTNERVHLYCGRIDSTGVGGIHGLEHEHEDIWVQVYDRQEAFQAFQEGYISSASAIIALQWLQVNYQRLQDKWQ